MSQFHISYNSKNSKTGNMVVTSSPRETCPENCPFKGNGCYGDNYGVNFLWNKISNGTHVNGLDWKTFIHNLEHLPPKSKVRHNQIGDLPGDSNTIDEEKLEELTFALIAYDKRPFTYTHKELNEQNVRALKKANEAGFAINISCETDQKAVLAIEHGLPAVLVKENSSERFGKLSNGHPTVVCPKQWYEGMKELTCAGCMLCANNSPKRPVVIFWPHGSKKKNIQMVLQVVNS